MAGKSYEDRILSSEVRSLALTRMKRILETQKPKGLYTQILVSLSRTVLPRLNEVSGPDGAPIPLLDVLHHKSASSDRK